MNPRLDEQLRLLIWVALLLLSMVSLAVLAGCGKMPTEDTGCKKAVTVMRDQAGDSIGVVEWKLCGGATLAT